MLFDETKDTYQDTIEQSIAFAGKRLDFYTAVKADYLREIIKYELPKVETPSLLDIGCGHGLIHSYLKKFGFQVNGIEVAKEVISLTKKANPEVAYQEYNGNILPFEDNSFDITLAICVMHHVPPEQWIHFSSEMRRVLRPGGIAIIFEHNPLNPLTRYVVGKNKIDDDAILLSSFTLKKLFQDTDFTKIRTTYILFTPFAMHVFRTIDRKLGWCPFGAQYFVIGKKDSS